MGYFGRKRIKSPDSVTILFVLTYHLCPQNQRAAEGWRAPHHLAQHASQSASDPTSQKKNQEEGEDAEKQESFVRFEIGDVRALCLVQQHNNALAG